MPPPNPGRPLFFPVLVPVGGVENRLGVLVAAPGLTKGVLRGLAYVGGRLDVPEGGVGRGGRPELEVRWLGVNPRRLPEPDSPAKRSDDDAFWRKSGVAKPGAKPGAKAGANPGASPGWDPKTGVAGCAGVDPEANPGKGTGETRPAASGFD